MKQSLINTFKLIRDDMQYRCDYEHKPLHALRILGFLLNPTIFSQTLFRFQAFFYTHHLKWIASILESINSILFTVSIHSSAEIGPGLLMLHANYINVGKHVKIGKNCIFAQQNTVAPAYTLDAISDIGPTIGDNVLLGVGSSVIGAIKLGNNTKVGINTSVEKDFPDNAILIGVPAKNVNLS